MNSQTSDSKFTRIEDLEVYQLARELSRFAWHIFEKLEWHERKIIGDQFLESTDSVGANIAEGYSRYHFLDKIKFYYNARGSLAECNVHWLDLLRERGKISKEEFESFKSVARKTEIKLNNFISSTYKTKAGFSRS